MKRKKDTLTLGKILKKIAPAIGASITIEPSWGYVGQIVFKNGKHSYYRYNTLDINPVGSSDLAKDKDYSNFFMKKMGYPVVPSCKIFFSKEREEELEVTGRGIDEAYTYACQIGLPVIVKPNSGSQGTDVALVSNKAEFYKAVRAVFKRDKIVMVQQQVVGKDYRIVVLDTKVISAYQRIPLNIVGDGISTIEDLLHKKQKQFIKQGRDTKICVTDTRIHTKLKRQGYSLSSVLKKGEQVFLLDNANLSTGGDALDVTESMHPAFKKIAIKLTKDMGLRLAGVDIMVSGDITQKPGTYWILEINAAPGLDHYVKMGREQERIVEDLYLQILKRMER